MALVKRLIEAHLRDRLGLPLGVDRLDLPFSFWRIWFEGFMRLGLDLLPIVLVVTVSV